MKCTNNISTTVNEKVVQKLTDSEKALINRDLYNIFVKYYKKMK